MKKVFWNFIGMGACLSFMIPCKAKEFRPNWAQDIHVVIKWPDEVELQSRLRLERKLSNLFQESFYQLDSFLPLSVKKKLKTQKLVIEVRPSDKKHGLFVGKTESSTIYLTIHSLLRNDGKSLLFHEFFHFIHHLYRPQEKAWLKEGMATLFEYYLTNHAHWKSLKAFSEDSHRPLVVDYDPLHPNLIDYGQSFLFLYYLQEKCGGVSVLWSLTQSTEESTGVEIIDNLMKKHPTCQGFYPIHRDFLIARAHNKPFLQQHLIFRYQLFPTTSPLTPVYSLNGETLGEELKTLLPGTELLIDSLDMQKIQGLPSHIEILFLEKHFPYQVLEHPPQFLEDFYILFLYPY